MELTVNHYRRKTNKSIKYSKKNLNSTSKQLFEQFSTSNYTYIIIDLLEGQSGKEQINLNAFIFHLDHRNKGFLHCLKTELNSNEKK